MTAAWLALVAGCSGVSYDTSHEFDATADFSKVHTFDWFTGTQTFSSDRDVSLRKIIGVELEAKGLRRDETAPDVLVAVYRSIVGTLNTKKSGYEWSDGHFTEYEIQEGTLVIDLIDAKDKKGIWRGIAKGAYRADALPEERREFLSAVLREMFAGYPPHR
jgi:hypothetical protein